MTLGTFTKIGVLYTATLVGLNYSLVSCIYSLAPFIVVVLFFFIFKERLHSIHIFGILSLCICIVFISLGSVLNDTTFYFMSILPIILAMLFAIIIAIN